MSNGDMALSENRECPRSPQKTLDLTGVLDFPDKPRNKCS